MILAPLLFLACVVRDLPAPIFDYGNILVGNAALLPDGRAFVIAGTAPGEVSAWVTDGQSKTTIGPVALAGTGFISRIVVSPDLMRATIDGPGLTATELDFASGTATQLSVDDSDRSHIYGADGSRFDVENENGSNITISQTVNGTTTVLVSLDGVACHAPHFLTDGTLALLCADGVRTVVGQTFPVVAANDPANNNALFFLPGSDDLFAISNPPAKPGKLASTTLRLATASSGWQWANIATVPYTSEVVALDANHVLAFADTTDELSRQSDGSWQQTTFSKSTFGDSLFYTGTAGAVVGNLADHVLVDNSIPLPPEEKCGMQTFTTHPELFLIDCPNAGTACTRTDLGSLGTIVSTAKYAPSGCGAVASGDASVLLAIAYFACRRRTRSKA